VSPQPPTFDVGIWQNIENNCRTRSPSTVPRSTQRGKFRYGRIGWRTAWSSLASPMASPQSSGHPIAERRGLTVRGLGSPVHGTACQAHEFTGSRSKHAGTIQFVPAASHDRARREQCKFETRGLFLWQLSKTSPTAEALKKLTLPSSTRWTGAGFKIRRCPSPSDALKVHGVPALSNRRAGLDVPNIPGLRFWLTNQCPRRAPGSIDYDPGLNPRCTDRVQVPLGLFPGTIGVAPAPAARPAQAFVPPAHVRRQHGMSATITAGPFRASICPSKVDCPDLGRAATLTRPGRTARGFAFTADREVRSTCAEFDLSKGRQAEEAALRHPRAGERIISDKKGPTKGHDPHRPRT